ncbi:TspO/MBR-related protein [Thelonectria olida]|uniref:TspO/MBR-related protein n=1 Tax=Thelonectria olida TaxID=1576542 RepID=A0A9P9AW01_9HYPO|nr:TspO/MBR-related protein [Thelonectria olida]
MTTFIPSLTLPSGVFLNPAVSVLLPIGLGIASGLSATQTQKTYLSLKKPELYPPPWLFGPVWTVLYGLMGYTAYRATFNGLSPLNSPATISAAHEGMTLYTIQLGLNLIWTPLFFGFNRPILATIDIVSLLGVNAYLTYVWSSVDPVASLCQVPYLGWLSFATYLCSRIGYLNNWDLSGKSGKQE